jgi:hypothetical protein
LSVLQPLPGICRQMDSARFSRTRAACQDVYEWESPGEGSCSEGNASYSAKAGGCVYLISDGKSPEPAYFGDADPSGQNVFFFTSDSLVPADGDNLYDIYDAAENGGLAAQFNPAAVPCAGEACQGEATGQPAFTSPASSTLSAPDQKSAVKKHRKTPRKVCKKGSKCKHRKRHSPARHAGKKHSRAEKTGGHK